MTYFPAQTHPWKQDWIETETTYLLDEQSITEPLRLNYWRVENADAPKLVFLHGWAEYGLDMERLAEPFWETCDVLALDARAHGLSDGPSSRYTTRERVDDIVSVLSALSYEPDVFIGHSMGANCILALSIDRPDLVKKAVLLDPSWNKGLEVQDENERQAAKHYWERTMKQWDRFSEKQLLRFAAHSFPYWQDIDHLRWMEGKKMLNVNTLNGYDTAAPTWGEYIDRIQCEGVVVMGDEETGALVSREIAEITQQRWTGLKQIIQIPGADHYVHHYDVTPIQEAIWEMIKD